ncbi:MAG: MOSC domain-containing protein, partial [Acidimicrobiia bacterium]
MPSLYQINISNGGVPKRPIKSAEVTSTGIVGDSQNDDVHHGGEERAICLFSLEVIEKFRDEGHPISPGSAGENLTLEGMTWDLLTPGSRLMVGPDVEIEITSYTAPCAKNAAWFADGDFTRMMQGRHPGESRL